MNRSQIKAMTNSTTYAKGQQLYQGDKVLELSVLEEDDGYTNLEALVKGSGRNKYSVNIVIDEVDDALVDINCECPAFFSYSGICKHCVAVLIEYSDYVSRKNVVEQRLKKQEQSLEKLQELKGVASLAEKKQEAIIPKTTPQIKDLLSKQQIRRGLPILQTEIYGKVKLEPFLTIRDETDISLEFKIGVTRMYVLQDILIFIRTLEKQEQREYGIKLNFVHTPEMFDETSNRIIQFLERWQVQNWKKFQSYSYYGYTTTSLRAISLTAAELEQFLETMGDEPVSAAWNRGEMQLWQPTGEPLPRNMTITGMDGGIEVEINKLLGLRGSETNIYFIEGKIYRSPRREMESIREFMDIMAGIPQRKIFIQSEDIPVFCRELLPKLEKCFSCTKEGFDESEFGILQADFEFYLDAPQNDVITCKPVAVYGDKKYDVYGDAMDIQRRDIVREVEIKKIVSEYTNAYDDTGKSMAAAQNEEKIYELLVRGIPQFQKLGEVYISDQLKKINLTKAPKVSVGVSLSGDLLELSMTAEDMTRNQLVEILSKYDRKKKFYRMKNGDFIIMEGEDFQALLELKEGLNLTDAQLQKQAVTLPKYRALYLDAELKERQGISASKDKAFKTLIRNMKTVEDNDFEIPDSLSNILREYQKRGFLWLKTLRHNGFGGILADDMGLGKTLQVIAFLESEIKEAGQGENKRTLIVSPASLVFNWNSELQKFAPDLPVKMVVGTAAQRRSMIQESGDRDILLTSYDLLKRDVEVYRDLVFFCQVADEAQYIKNHNTQAAKAVKSVSSGFKLALTGTPVENRLSELWSIFDYLMPGFLYGYQRFKDELEVPVVQNQDETAIARLQKMIRPFVLRRLKRDVLTDLPDKLEKCVFAKMEGEQQKLYDAHVKRMKMLLEKQSDEEFQTSKIQILSELTKLRQICCNPSLLFESYHAQSVKTDMCIDLIENAISGGHKLLLFSQFTSMLEKLQDELSARKIPFYVLTGAVSKEKRAKMVEQFNQDDTPVFCISLKAGGTGLNLTGADMVIHYDPWWNIAVQNQATDRAHRIGQKQVVMVYKLIVKDTIEENIMKLQEKKRELADQILSGEGLDSGNFSREELLGLL